MKKILLSIIFMSLTSNSFSQINSFAKKGIISIDLKNKQVKEVTEINKNDDLIYSNVNLNFICDKEMQSFETETELKSFITKNPSKTNGIIEFSIDNEVIYRVQIINGIKANEENLDNSSLNKAYPCTYQGVRQCVREGIRNQNWLQYIMCVGEGLGCVVEWYANCVIDNC